MSGTHGNINIQVRGRENFVTLIRYVATISSTRSSQGTVIIMR